MSNAALIINRPGGNVRELEISGDVSIGRASDNFVRIEGDPNVAPHHALIELRDDAYWLLNLVLARRTTVNDEAVATERQLQDGDRIRLGGTSLIEFHFAGASPRASAGGDGSAAGSQRPAGGRAPAGGGGGGASPAGGLSWPLIAVAVVCAVMLVVVFALLVAYFFQTDCHGTARIISPLPGSTIREPTEIVVEPKETRCIERVSYQLNGVEFARAETQPYTVTLDPADFKHLPGGSSHILTATVENRDGRKQLQPDGVLLAFAPAGGKPPAPSPSALAEGPTTVAPPAVASSVSTTQVQQLSAQLASQLSGMGGYVFDGEFAMLIRDRTEDFRQGGHTARAQRFCGPLNVAFQHRGVDPLFGYITALSRSRFNEDADGGVWQLPPAVVQRYAGAGGAADEAARRQRSSGIAARYTESLTETFDEGDFMYAMACFGQPLSEAGTLRAALARRDPDASLRRDFCKMVKLGVVTREQRQRVVDFFAAGIVAENPQTFGLNGERRFSDFKLGCPN